jgi:uncharacterized protein (UPF0548 family)
MFCLHKPSEQKIKDFLAAQHDQVFSYAPIGLTRHLPDSGYTIDHSRVQLGQGAPAFQAACLAIQNWKMFDIGWVHLFQKETPIETGSIVAVVVAHLGFWSLNACRIVYTLDEPQARYGFAYGTLTAHAERGEECFSVEWNHQDDSVWYQVVAVSKPGPVARFGYPYTRYLQKRFARDSKRAMRHAVAGIDV